MITSLKVEKIVYLRGEEEAMVRSLLTSEFTAGGWQVNASSVPCALLS